MTSLIPAISVCRNCQHYLSEGRRGGQCKQLGAPVQGSWKACSLAIPPFAPSWELPEEIKLWHRQSHECTGAVSPTCTLEALEACVQSEIASATKLRSEEAILVNSSHVVYDKSK